MRCGALRAAVVSGGVSVLLSDVLLAGWCLLQVVVHMLSSLAAVQLLQTSWVTGGGGGFSLLQCIVSVMGPNHSGGFPAADSGLLSSFSFPPLLQVFFLAGHESPEPESSPQQITCLHLLLSQHAPLSPLLHCTHEPPLSSSSSPPACSSIFTLHPPSFAHAQTFSAFVTLICQSDGLISILLTEHLNTSAPKPKKKAKKKWSSPS